MLVQKDLIQNKLKQMSLEAKGEWLYEIYRDEWEERPVGIEQFITDPHFLGRSFVDESGNLILFPFWQQELKKLYRSPFIKQYFEIILKAPIGSGKSYVTTISMLYEAYLLMMKKNPQGFSTRPKLGRGTQIVLIIFSLDLGSANQNWGYAKTFVTDSPFFSQFSQKMGETKYMPSNSFCLHEEKQIFLNLGSNTAHQISRAIHSGVFDEADFHKGFSETPKEKYDALYNRIGSRFPNFEGILWLVTSANSENAFSDQVVLEAKKNNKSKIYLVKAQHQWLIKGEQHYPSGRFEVFAGDNIRDPFIVDNENKHLILPDMKIEKVPINLEGVFKNNLAKALRDYMNVATVGTIKFCRSKNQLKECMTNNNKLLISGNAKDIISLDFNNKEDTLIQHFENIDYFKNPMHPYAYRFLHMDLGRRKDKFGIACTYAYYREDEYYRQDMQVNVRPERYFITEWVLSIKAIKGQDIPYQKIIDLLVWLKGSCKYNIALVTTDQPEGGAKFRQDLNLAGIESKYLSVDKTRDAYETTQGMINAGRIILPNSPLLFLEYTELIDDGIKIDHPKVFVSTGEEGSKDICDGLVGSVFLAHQAEKIFNPAILLNDPKINQSNKLNNFAKQEQFKNLGNNFLKNYYG